VCCDFCECAYHDIKCLNVKADELFDPWACPKCAGNLTQVMDDYKLRKRKRKRTEKKARRLMIEEGSHVAEVTTAAKSRVATPTHHDTHTLSARGTNKKRACLEESDDEPREHACAVEQPVLVACTAKGADAKQQQARKAIAASDSEDEHMQIPTDTASAPCREIGGNGEGGAARKGIDASVKSAQSDVTYMSDAHTYVCGNECTGDESAATHWCFECHMSICPFCVTGHKRQSILRSHLLVEIQVCSNGCEGADAAVTHVCHVCKTSLCAFCVKGHQRQTSLKTHTLIQILP